MISEWKPGASRQSQPNSVGEDREGHPETFQPATDAGPWEDSTGTVANFPTRHTMKLNILHLVIVSVLTVAVIVNYDKALWAACCLLMGKEVGNAIKDLIKP